MHRSCFVGGECDIPHSDPLANALAIVTRRDIAAEVGYYTCVVIYRAARQYVIDDTVVDSFPANFGLVKGNIKIGAGNAVSRTVNVLSPHFNIERRAKSLVSDRRWEAGSRVQSARFTHWHQGDLDFGRQRVGSELSSNCRASVAGREHGGMHTRGVTCRHRRICELVG